VTGPGRHPLIDEVKSELDIVFEAVRETERLFSSPALRDEATDDLVELYRMQAEGAERFALITALFAAAQLAETPERTPEYLSQLYPDFDAGHADLDGHIAEFAGALRHFLHGEGLSENDRAVRTHIAAIEAVLLAGLGEGSPRAEEREAAVMA
jgi:hypothetical protein